MRRHIPPVRICPGCGGEHRAWAEQVFCAKCRKDGSQDEARENGRTLAEMVREARLARRAARE